ncbi:hypothetical protein [Microlunatus speluncae]|uniref:hypothetical protein n=1 Tax=Microlunatus speluncae TaxID=2594267 RepID=UPI0012666139|nr:hypothetical protein [Microlunatus speluncae]
MVYGPIALILVAAGVFLGLVVRRNTATVRDRDVSGDQLLGFAMVGVAAMIGLGVLVMIIGLVTPPEGLAESVGLLALSGFLLYLVVAAAVIVITRQRWVQRWDPPPESAPAQQPGDGDPGGDGPGHPADHRGGDQP